VALESLNIRPAIGCIQCSSACPYLEILERRGAKGGGQGGIGGVPATGHDDAPDADLIDVRISVQSEPQTSHRHNSVAIWPCALLRTGRESLN
jgi:hypothetical protein